MSVLESKFRRTCMYYTRHSRRRKLFVGGDCNENVEDNFGYKMIQGGHWQWNKNEMGDKNLKFAMSYDLMIAVHAFDILQEWITQ